MRRQLDNDDLYRLCWVSEPQLAPGGQQVAYVRSWLDPELDAEVSSVCVVSRDGRLLLEVSAAGRRFQAPRWSPGGDALALLSDCGGTMQVWFVDPLSGERHGATDLAGTPVGLDWSPDSAMLAVTVETVRPVGDGPGHLVTEERLRNDGSSDYATVRSDLWLLSREDGALEPLGLGGARTWHPRWAPCGRTLAFLRAERALGQACGLWTVDLAVGRHPVRVVEDTGPIRAFAWSPDGSTIAYVHHDGGEAADLNHALWQVEPGTGGRRNLTDGLDRSVGLAVRSDDRRGTTSVLAWSPESGRIYFEMAEGGKGPLGWVDPGGGAGSLAEGERVVLQPSTAKGGGLAAVVTDPLSPGEVVLLSEGDGSVVQLSRANDWLDDVALPRTELIEARSPDGTRLEGWLTSRHDPPTAEARQSLVVSVHGGPHYAIGWRFCFEHLRLAAQGYAVLVGNLRGSLGYGEGFSSALQGRWGEIDQLDLEALVEVAASRPAVDRRRMAVSGVSYGGFLAQSIITRSRMFRTAVSENGISNFLSLWGANQDLGLGIELALGGPPWLDAAEYVERSPICRAQHVRASLLLLHAEDDGICPIEQSEQMRAALQRLGGEVEMVRLNGEGHLVNLVGRPSRRRLRATVIDEWLGKHLGVAGVDG